MKFARTVRLYFEASVVYVKNEGPRSFRLKENAMKPVQKLEIVFGLGTFLSAVAYFFGFVLPFAKFNYENYGASDSVTVFVQGVLLLIIPGGVAGSGAYFLAKKANRLAFIAVVSGGSILALFFAANLYTGTLFYVNGLVTGLIVLIPFILAVLTLVFAFLCRRASLLQHHRFQR